MSKLIRYIYKALIKTGFHFLDLFIVRPRKTILFGSGFGGFSDNSKYLFLYMLKSNYENIYYVLGDKAEYDRLKAQYPVLYKNSFVCFFKALTARYYFFTHNIDDVYYVKGLHAIAVNLWHGTPIKKIGYDTAVEMKWIKRKELLGLKIPYQLYDYVVSSHSSCSSSFLTGMRIANDKIIDTGLPRNDSLFDSKGDEVVLSSLKEKIYKSPGKKTILYAPTFRDDDKQDVKYIEELIDLFGENELLKSDYVLGLRLHPLLNVGLGLKKFGDNVLDLSYCDDMQEVLMASDVLITDYSSLLFDYSILERPIIIYCYDLEEYQSVRGGFYYDFEDEFSGYSLCRNTECILSAIENCHLYENEGFFKRFNKQNASKNILSFLNI